MIRQTLFFGLLVSNHRLSVNGFVLLPRSCPLDFQCQRGECCRDSSGTIVSTQSMHGIFVPTTQNVHGGFMPTTSPNNAGGTCSSKLAQHGEICDSNCHCEPGQECYHHLNGLGFPYISPRKCHNATWVQQQREYWAKCWEDPYCIA